MHNNGFKMLLESFFDLDRETLQTIWNEAYREISCEEDGFIRDFDDKVFGVAYRKARVLEAVREISQATPHSPQEVAELFQHFLAECKGSFERRVEDAKQFTFQELIQRS